MANAAQFGPYELVEEIATSDIAVSYGVTVSTSAGAKRTAALKILNPSLTQDAEFTARLLDEVRLAEQLSHVNLAQTWDCGERQGAYYLLLEYVEGLPLSAILQRGVVSQSVAVYIASEVAAGLAYAHGRRDKSGSSLGVVHGDVRPRNILVSAAGAVKLIDFGVARARKNGAEDPVPPALRELDLFAYADPEHARGAVPTAASDVFSVSALLWSMLAGRRLFEGDNHAEVHAAAQVGTILPLLDVNPSVEPSLAAIVMRGLRAGAEGERDFAGAQALRTALTAWLREHDAAFGRHRIKEEFSDFLGQAELLKKNRALTRREFNSEDPASVIFKVDANPDDRESVLVTSLFEDGGRAALASAAASMPPPPPPRGSTTSLAPMVDLDDDEVLDDLDVLDDDDAGAEPPRSSASPVASSGRLSSPSSTPPAAPTPQSGPPSVPPSTPPASSGRTSLPPSAPPASSGRTSLPPSAPPASSGRTSLPPSAPPASSGRTSLPPSAPPASSGLAAAVAEAKAAAQAKTISRGPTPSSGRSSLPPLASSGRSSVPPSTPAAAPEARPSTMMLSPVDDVAADDALNRLASLNAHLPPSTPLSKEPSVPGRAPLTLSTNNDEFHTEVTKPNALSPNPPNTSLRMDSSSYDALQSPDMEAESSFVSIQSTGGRKLSADAVALDKVPTSPRSATKVDENFDPNVVLQETSHFYDDEPEPQAAPTRSSSAKTPLIALLALVVVGLVGYIVVSKSDTSSKPAAVATSSGLNVTSTPAQARIYIDDVDTGKQTPHVFHDIEVGKSVRIRAELPGFEASPTVTAQVAAGSVAEIALELRAIPHIIKINSEPPGAIVYIDGNQAGVTPANLGPYTVSPNLGVNISVQLDGYKPKALQHTWQAGSNSSDVSVELEPLNAAPARRR